MPQALFTAFVEKVIVSGTKKDFKNCFIQGDPRQKCLTDEEADGITPQKVLGGEWYKAWR